MSAPAASVEARTRAQRGAGMAMLGSAIALGVVSALAFAGVLSFDPAVRGWIAGGIAVAAIVDAAMAVYFLRAASQS